MIENNLESLQENLVSIRDFERELDLIIGNKLERFGYLRSARDQKVAFVFYLHEDKDNKFSNWIRFTSYVFIDDKEEIEIEINKKFYRRFEKPHVWGVFILNNVKIVFEAEIGPIISEDKDIYSIRMLKPKRMIRYQRRDAYRVAVPSFSNLSIDLENDPDNKDLVELPVINLSVGGAAVLFNTNKDIDLIPDYFNNASLNLENQIFRNLKVKVCRISVFNYGAIPFNIAAKKTALNWYELGLKFEKLPYNVEQELVIFVNNMSKKLNR